MCTHEPSGTVYSLHNGVAVPKKLALELVGVSKLQGDLLLRPNEDGLFAGFSQTWRAERRARERHSVLVVTASAT
jgi:hypothetical protein